MSETCAVSRRSSTSRGDLRVEPLEVAVDGLEVLADLLAAALEGGGQRVQGLVELGRLHRAQQRVEVGEHLLDLDRDVGALDGGAGLDVARRRRLPSGTSRETYFSPNRVLGTIEPVTLAGIVSIWLGVEAQGELGAVGVGVEVEHLADDDAADLDVGARGQLQADRGGLAA